MDLTYTGIVYEREDAQKAINLFFAEKVDFIIAEFLSWSEDFAWIRFLRDCPDIQPFDIILANELDDGCARSGNRNTARELAKAFGLADFSDVISFALLIIVLVVKPTGLFGEKTTEKV